MWRAWVLPALQPWKWPLWLIAGADRPFRDHGSGRAARRVYEESLHGR